MDRKMGEWEQNSLINVLLQGRESAKQLQIQLNLRTSSSSPDQTRGIMLVQKIISSYDKALSMLNFCASSSSTQEPQLPAGPVTESPTSLTGSPLSEDSDRDVKDPQEDVSKKRKTFPRWTHKVRVNPGAGLEGPLDDGCSWRKYGQKDILGAKYPRGYYRCTYRNGQGCLATKQVQRSDEDPRIFEITYRGNHTCAQASNAIFPSPTQPETKEPDTAAVEPQQHNYYQTTPQQQPEEALLNLRKGLKIVTEDLDVKPQQQSSIPPFHFPSPSPSPSVVIHPNFTGNFSPSFVSPQASEANNYTFSTSPPSGMNNFQGNQNFQSSSHDSEVNEIISGAAAAAAATSATNPPTVDLDFPFGNIEFDPNFTFDNLGFFSSFHHSEKNSK